MPKHFGRGVHRSRSPGTTITSRSRCRGPCSIAAKSRYAITLAKQSLNACEALDIKRGYELEQGFTVRLSEHPDSKIAVEARIAEMAKGAK